MKRLALFSLATMLDIMAAVSLLLLAIVCVTTESNPVFSRTYIGAVLLWAAWRTCSRTPERKPEPATATTFGYATTTLEAAQSIDDMLAEMEKLQQTLIPPDTCDVLLVTRDQWNEITEKLPEADPARYSPFSVTGGPPLGLPVEVYYSPAEITIRAISLQSQGRRAGAVNFTNPSPDSESLRRRVEGETDGAET